MSDEQTDIFDYRRGTISCAVDGEEGEAHWWTTDDGYHWYAEGTCGRGAGGQLETYERKILQVHYCTVPLGDAQEHR